MKNWKVIGWIILFFPLGIYYMYTYTNWSKKLIYGISGLYGSIVLISLLSGVLPELGLLSGFTFLITSIGLMIKSLIQKTNKKYYIGLLVSSGLLVGVTSANIEVVNPEVRIASEIEEREKQEEIERLEEERINLENNLSDATLAVEKAEEEKTRPSLDNAYDLLENLSIKDRDLIERLEVIEEHVLAEEVIQDFLQELEKAEHNPTKARITRLENLLLDIETPDPSLIARIDTLQAEFEAVESAKSDADLALKAAEADPTWENHETAALAISSVPTSSDSLISRLETVENTILSNEEQAKREAEKRAAEIALKAEEESKMQEEAKRKAQEEANRQAQEKAESNTEESLSSSPSSPPSNNESTTEVPAVNGEQALLTFLNNASHSELQAVSYIGPKRATYIIEYRQSNGPFTSSNQVTNVNQIGDGIYSNLRDMFN